LTDLSPLKYTSLLGLLFTAYALLFVMVDSGTSGPLITDAAYAAEESRLVGQFDLVSMFGIVAVVTLIRNSATVDTNILCRNIFERLQ